jgi:glycosyltransferase involved in cell wall biosynthesis
MRVLLTADLCGGVLTWALELVAQLAGQGVEADLVTFGPPASRSQRSRIEASRVSAWHESDLALEWMADPWEDLARASELVRELERVSQPDVVHLSSFGHAAAGFSAPVVITAHSDVWSWWQAVHGWDPPRAWDRYRAWVGDGLRAAEAVIAPTATTLAELGRNYGPWAGRALVIPNAVSLPDGERSAGTGRDPVALAAGRLWDAAKNAEALAEAAAQLPAGAVRIAGDPRGAPDLAPAVVLGELSAAELAAERRRALVFVSPARYEPFGLAVLEAALDRCALVLGDIPSLHELWHDVAWFVDPDDPAALASAIRSLVADPQAARDLGERARDRARAFGGPTAFGAAHHELYGQLARMELVVPR